MRLILLIALCCWSAQAATYYVSTSGTDGSGVAGSEAAPWRTIAYGVGRISGGDTLILRGGNYDEPGFVFPVSKSGTSESSRTIIKSYTGERAVFRPTNSRAHGLWTLDTVRVSNVTFDSWTIDFGLKNINAQSNSAFGNLKFHWVTNLTFTNMHFLNNTNSSLTYIYPGKQYTNGYGPGGNVLVSGCLFSNVTVAPWGGNTTSTHAPAHPIYWNTLRDVTVENNTFVRGHSYAIHCWLTSTQSGTNGTNWVIRGNYITNFANGIYLFAGDSKVYNNVLLNLSADGIGLGSRRTLYANNTIYSTGGRRGIWSAGYDDDYVNNIVWGTWTRGLETLGRLNTFSNNVIKLPWTTNAGSPYITGTTHTDPLFLSAPTDLRIGSTSPARATGYDLSSVFTADYYGNERTIWDRGAFAFNSQAPEEEDPPIEDPDPLPLVSVSQTGDAFEINSTISTFVVSRAGSSDGNLNVVFAMTGTASSNVNYTLSHSSPVTINNAEWTQTITLTPVDLQTVGTLDATLTIQPDAAYTVAANSNATIVIYGSGSGETGFRRTYGGGAASRRGRL